MPVLKLKQAQLKKRIQTAQLTKLLAKIQAEDFDIEDLNLREQRFAAIISELSDCFDFPFENGENEETDNYVTEQEQIFDTHDEIEFKLNRIKNESKVKETVSGSNPSTSVRLPKISLLIFSVSLHEWLSFKDIFNATTHQNKDLLNEMK